MANTNAYRQTTANARPAQPQEPPKIYVHQQEVAGIHGVYDAYATVTRDLTPVKEVSVEFRVDGKVVGHATTNTQGKAHLELNLKPKINPRQPDEEITYHEYAITAHIVNTQIVSNTDHILVMPKEDCPLTPLEHTMVVSYLVMFFMYGPGTLGFKAMLFIPALLIIAIVAKMRGKTLFYAFWEENDWLVFSIIGMALVSGLILHRSHTCKMLIFPWGVMAGIVSKWDNVVQGMRKRKRKKALTAQHAAEHHEGKFWEHMKFDTLFDVIKTVLKAVFRGIF